MSTKALTSLIAMLYDKDSAVLTTEQLYSAAGWLEDKGLHKSMHTVTASATQDYRAASGLSTSLFFDPIDDDEVTALLSLLSMR
jgi:hypothetical protein